MFTVKCFRPYVNLPEGYKFYVLNRGYNSGRPSYSSNPNCFVVSCETEQERLELFWACKALHLNGRFKHHLVGSVIELLRITDFKRVLDAAHAKMKHSDKPLLDAVRKVEQIQAFRQHQEKQAKLVTDLQSAMLADIFIK